MRHIKNINESWSDKYTTDFKDKGFEIVDYNKIIKAKYKGSFVTTDINELFADMVLKIDIDYKILRTKSFFNSVTGNGNFEVEVSEKDAIPIKVKVGNNIVDFYIVTSKIYNNRSINILGRLDNGALKTLYIRSDGTKILGTRASGIDVDEDNLNKIYKLITTGAIEFRNRIEISDDEIYSILKGLRKVQ